jgi:hypothetical protein
MTWIQEAKLIISGDRLRNQVLAVSLHVDTVAIGVDAASLGLGVVYVYTRTGTIWSQEAKLDGFDNMFGHIVSLYSDTLAVGAVGAVYVYTRSGTTWRQEAMLSALDGVSVLGTSVSLSGDTLAVGAVVGGTGDESVYVYTRSGTTWIQEAKIIFSDGPDDRKLQQSMSLSDDTLAVGTVGADDRGPNSGSVSVFTRSGTTWVLETKLVPLDGAPDDNLGESVSLSGNTLVVGAIGDDDKGADSGSVYVYTRSGTMWTQQEAKLFASDGAMGDKLGRSVSLSGNTIAVGAPDMEHTGGSVYTFDTPSASLQTYVTTWDQVVALYNGGSSSIDIHGDMRVTSTLTLSRDVVFTGKCEPGPCTLTRSRAGRHFLLSTCVTNSCAVGFKSLHFMNGFSASSGGWGTWDP